MEWGLLRDFFGNFSTRGERYYFRVEGTCEMRIVTQGKKYLCEVTLRVVEGTLGHARWTQGEI